MDVLGSWKTADVDIYMLRGSKWVKTKHINVISSGKQSFNATSFVYFIVAAFMIKKYIVPFHISKGVILSINEAPEWLNIIKRQINPHTDFHWFSANFLEVWRCSFVCDDCFVATHDYSLNLNKMTFLLSCVLLGQPVSALTLIPLLAYFSRRL